MAPPNNPIDTQEKIMGKCFDLSYGKFSVNGVTLFSEASSNVFFNPFCSNWRSFDAPLLLIQDVLARSYKGGFLGFHKEKPSDRLINSLGWVNSMV
jgi:stachyose synthetase